MSPRPYFAIKLIDFAEAFDAGIIKSPSFSLLSSSTNTNILPRFASCKILFIFENLIFIILKNFSLRVNNTSWNLDWSKKSNIEQIVKNSELRNYIAANRGTKNIMKMRAKALIKNIKKVVNLIDTY